MAGMLSLVSVLLLVAIAVCAASWQDRLMERLPSKQHHRSRHRHHVLMGTSMLQVTENVSDFILKHVEYDGRDDNCNGGGAVGDKLLAAWEQEVVDVLDTESLVLLPGKASSENVSESVMYHGRCHKCGGVMFMQGAKAYIKAEEVLGKSVGFHSVSSDAKRFPDQETGEPSFYVCTHRSPETFLDVVASSKVRFKSISWQIRDPRDILISGYNYHKETTEGWAHWSQFAFNGMSYQEKLNSMETEEDGLLFEMEGRAKVTFRELYQWKMLEEHVTWATVDHFEYENMWDHPNETFAAVASFHNLEDPDVFTDSATEIVMNSHTATRTVHMHGGSTGAWKEHFTDTVKTRFKLLYGELVVKLGYEDNNDW